TGGPGPLDSTFGPRISGVAPYWRAAWEQDWARNSLTFGTFGIKADTHPKGTGEHGPTDSQTDVARDAQYQEIAVLVDPGQIGREDVGIADILVLGIERDIRLAVGRPMFARALRMGIGLDAEGAEGERVARPILLPRRAPIGRDPADARAESAVERSRPAGRAVAE